MSAKPKKHVNSPTGSPARPVPAPGSVAPLRETSIRMAAPAPISTAPLPAALDPSRSLTGKLVVGAVWLYVGALWLLALNQTFKWGIFGTPAVTVP